MINYSQNHATRDTSIQILFTFCRLLIDFASNSEVPAWNGYLYAVLLFVVAFTHAMLWQQYFIRVNTAGMRIKTAIIGAVYSKVIRVRWPAMLTCISNSTLHNITSPSRLSLTNESRKLYSTYVHYIAE